MISPDNRKAILDKILEDGDSFEFANNRDEGIIPFLNEIWDLNSMSSEDSRFNNAEGDIFQHTINNDDWTWRELFEVRLKLLEDSDKFTKFLEVFLRPEYQRDANLTLKLAEEFNEIIKKDGVALATVSYQNQFPILELTRSESLTRPIDVPLNKIKFYVMPSPKTNMKNFIGNLEADTLKPYEHFILIADNWDDYNHQTTFGLVHFKKQMKTFLGYVKIGHEKEAVTLDCLPSNFESLEDGFFSLGQSSEYYMAMKNLFGSDFRAVLYSLKDVAFFSEIQEEYETLNVFRYSLIRLDDAERLLRTAKPMVYGRDLENLYSFDYIFQPKYSNTSVVVPFRFSSHPLLPRRMVALIGKNGSGKTQLLTSLPQDIANRDSDSLRPTKPMYSKVIAVSYSTFDNFEIPKKTSEFNYVYCGLRDEKGDLRTKQGQIQKFHYTWKKIEKLGRLKKWRNIISNFIDVELINLFIKPHEGDSEQLYFDRLGFTQARESLSSGQSIILFVISEIVANIRFDSLLLFDEPETHLHPNAISRLVNGISDLVNEFESYCVIATHSPLIVQEMFSRDVLVITRESDIPSVRRIGIESFGENLSEITEEIFGNKEIPKHYKRTIEKLVQEKGSYDGVVGVIREGNLPLSLNIRLYIESLVEEYVKH